MDLRQLKALEIAARLRLTFDGVAWSVPPQSGDAPYRVTLSADHAACTCEDFALRAQPCKHILAVRLVLQRECGGHAPPFTTDAVPKKPSYSQAWPLYNRAQATEKHRFQKLLCDLCDHVPPPLPRRGRPPHALRDRVFAMTFKVYSTLSSRRFSCDLRDAHDKGYLLGPVPGMKVCAFFEDPGLTPVLQSLLVRSSLPLRAVETQFAPDSSGFSTSRFVRWFDEKYGCERSGKEWVKAHLITGVKTNIVTAVRIEDKNAADCPQFKPLVETTAAHFTIEEVPADKAYLSHENLELVAGLGGTAFIPFKANSTAGTTGGIWEKMYHYYVFRREEFLKHYHLRSNVESTISMVKAKFRDHVRSKTDVAMKNEVLCKFLAHNLCVVHRSHIELGLEPVFWAEQGRQEAAEAPAPGASGVNPSQREGAVMI